MLNHIFYGIRDVCNEYKEIEVTTNRVGQPIELATVSQCNVRVDTMGLNDDTTLAIKFEESSDGISFSEIGTFPIPDEHHGILFAKFKDHVRYTLILGGTNPNLDVTIQF